MGHHQERDTGSSSENGLAKTVSTPWLQLPVVSQLYRVLESWQAEFKPRHYDNSYALIPIERQECRDRQHDR
jgi:hypothetical protein